MKGSYTMKYNTIMYKDENINLKQTYTIEYIDNKQDFERLNSHPEPWELYKKKEFTDLSEAMDLFVHYYAWESILDVKLWEDISLNDEIIQTRCINSIFNFEAIADKVSQEIRRKDAETQANIKFYQDELLCMDAFIKKCKAEKIYREFKEEHNKAHN